MSCKSQNLDSHSFIAHDGYRDIHHTCKECGIHFDHLDGERFAICDICKYRSTS